MAIRVEPFRSFIAGGRLKEACEAQADDAEQLFARAHARVLAGRDADARADLEACSNELGDEARVELAHLDVRAARNIAAAIDACREAAERAPTRSALRARALHVLGLAQSKLRRSTEAVSSLSAARQLYRDLGDVEARAAVVDTLGSVYAAMGRADLALAQYSVALVLKTQAGDEYGAALTLGNVGRIHLRAERFDEAVECFELDLEIATRLGDARGEARMLEDLGRAQSGLGNAERALELFDSAVKLAEERAFRDIEVFARCDRASELLDAGRIDQARAELERARSVAGSTEEPYLLTVVDATAVRLELRQRTGAVLEHVLDVQRRLEADDLPDLELKLLFEAAESMTAWGRPEYADGCLQRAEALARRDGFARYLRRIREKRAKLDIAARLADEVDRLALPGQVAPDNGYLLLERVGCGAFGEVWRAEDPERGLEVAVKRLSLERVADPRVRRWIEASARTELKVAAAIRHPNVARVHAVGVDTAGGMYVVQDFVQGRSLRARMEETGAADAREAALVAEGVAWGLAALHTHDVVHRDLKPENVVLDEDGRPVLIDFGIAQRGGPGGDAAAPLAGTPAYMAPEQWRGQSVGAAADVYSLGVMLHEWLSGERHASDELAVEHASLARLRPDLSPRWVRCVERMLAVDAGARPQAREVALELRELAQAASRARS